LCEVNEHATISAIVPAFNAVGTIRAAVESILRQTRAVTDVVIVDDASTDGTRELLLKEFARHTLVLLDRNLGPAGARNAGIRKACGEWLAFLDGDDAWLPWRIEEQMNALVGAPDAVCVCGNVTLLSEPEPRVVRPGSARSVRDVSLEEFVDSNPAPTSTVLVSRAALAGAGGFDEQFRGPEDIDLWMRIAARGRMLKMDLPVALYREQPGSLCMSQDRFLPEIIRVYDKAFAPGGALYDHRQWRGRAIAGRYVSAAWSYMVCGRRGRALALLLRSWALWPHRLKIEESRPAWRLIMLARILTSRGA
jgi:glycosyltransferase involved in cell wall biosynthesis